MKRGILPDFLHMNPSYIKSIQSSLRQRKQIVLPKWHGLITSTVIAVSAYIIMAFQWSDLTNKAYHFASEQGAVTILSGIFFAIGSGCAFRAFKLFPKNARLAKYFWQCAAAVLAFFAMDELLRFHEAIGYLIDHSGITGPTDSFRNSNDIIVILYGIVGLGALMFFLPEVLKYPRLIEMLIISFTFYVIHTFIDSTFEPATLVSIVLEESAKLYCSTFLALSMFIGWLGAVDMNRKSV